MTVAERMQLLRDQFPECTLVAFADLAAEMVLSVNADTARIQEEINGLCATATDALGGPSIDAIFANGAESGVFEAVLVERQEIGVFLRSTVKQSDAFCCVCTPRISLGEFLPAARAALDASDMSP